MAQARRKTAARKTAGKRRPSPKEKGRDDLQMNIRLPGELHKEVGEAAEKQERSIAWMIRAALRHYLDCPVIDVKDRRLVADSEEHPAA